MVHAVWRRESMESNKQLVWRSSVLCLGLMFCSRLDAQQQGDKQRSVREPAASKYRALEPSDLAQDNLSRVAASATQIQAVLLKDEGLLVELKRWVAKEATDNGQVVDDSNLTDQAIFERLNQDVTFRSVATRLLQRFGYLMPISNPESDFAKEKDLILKERARRFVQIESQEDSEALHPRQDESTELQKVEMKACDPQADDDCDETSSRRTRSRRSRLNEPVDIDQGSPSFPNPALLPSAPSRTLRTSMDREGSSLQSASMMDGSQTTGTDALQRAMSGMSGMGAMDSLGMSGPSGSLDGLPLWSGGANPQSFSSLVQPSDRSTIEESKLLDRRMRRNERRWSERALAMERNASSVTMLHKANPFADIPSLYDMYVQASARETPQERFGLKLFRSDTLDPDDLPIDLPVGPDYVVGPGDGLAINLWGGVSSRLFRTVDREGRISLPEAGPLLVSGRTLGDVQQTVQQLLRTQYRDVSADVSLSRLRTVRVYVVGDVVEPGAYDIS